MMGNDQSHIKNLNFSEEERKPAEKINGCFLFDGVYENTKITVIEEMEHNNVGNKYFNGTALERSIKNLKQIRHPKVLKYMKSWKKGNLNVLAVERVASLSITLQKQNDIQICLGLKNILGSLLFFQQANHRHLNVGIQSIFVSEDGSWKMLGLEHLWKTTDLTVDLLTDSLNHRFKDAVDPNEVKNKGLGIEQYAFAVLCENIFKLRPSMLPHFSEFVDFCRTHLKHDNPSLRPLLSAVLLHPYLDHDFIKIHSFLSELPLKPASAKQDFFTNLAEKLRGFDENVVGSQLGELLLSRIVLLDVTFQTDVLPVLLKPQSEHTEEPEGIFSQKAFIKYLIPKLMQIFCVRDVQIRLLLLLHFYEYVLMFTKQELTDHILPQILLGIKDTNDLLVTKTLICLADLIPILGATVVIGNNRHRIFGDGRPQNVEDAQLNNWTLPRSITPVKTSMDSLSGSPSMDNVDISESEENGAKSNGMPTHEKNRLLNCFDDLKEQSDNTDQELEVDEWSDWEDNELVSNLLKLAIPGNTIPSYSTIIPVKKVQITAVQKSLKNDIKEQSDYINQELEVDEWSDRKDNKLDLNLLRYVIPGNTILKEIPSYSTIVPDKRVELTALQKSIKPPVNDNIDELDIKNQKFSKIEEKARSELDDLFKDMEPVIQKTSRLVIEEAETVPKIVEEKLPEPISIDNTRFEMKIDVAEETDQEEGGWGDSNEDWE